MAAIVMYLNRINCWSEDEKYNDFESILQLTDYGGLQIDEDGTGYVFAGTSLAEEGVEGIITTADGFIGGHLAVRLDTVLQTVQLPAGITDLNTGLANMDGDTFTLKKKWVNS